MKIVNRGYILVTPKKPFIDWVQTQDEEIELFGEVEPSVYLIEEDFYDDEPIIKANFKAIFYNELDAVSETDDDYPSIDLETFMTWFDVKLGSSVFDAQSSDLKRD